MSNSAAEMGMNIHGVTSIVIKSVQGAAKNKIHLAIFGMSSETFLFLRNASERNFQQFVQQYFTS